MSKKNIRIIDKTLTVLFRLNKENFIKKIDDIRRLCKLLSILGCTHIEITSEIYDYLIPLPKDIDFIVNVNNIINIPQTKLLEAIKGENKRCDYDSIRVIGLSDLMFTKIQKNFNLIIEKFGKNVELEVLDNYKSANAIAYEWINYGGESIVGSFTGIGGYPAIETIISSLKFINNLISYSNTNLLPEIKDIFENITNKKISVKTPIIGEQIFDVESGIHVDGIIKNPKNYEPYCPEEVGRSRKIIIGNYTGKNALKYKLKELEINMDENSLIEVLKIIKESSLEKCRGLYDNEIYNICKGVLL